jgi:glycine cleavage system H protein
MKTKALPLKTKEVQLKQIKQKYHLSKNNKGEKMKKYNEEHEWIELNNEIGTVGISKYAITQLGDITFIELPEVNSDVDSGDSVAFIESVKAASDIYTPVSGNIIEVNEDLLDNPESLNEDALNISIFKIKLSDIGELDNLMDEEAYQEYIKTLD